MPSVTLVGLDTVVNLLNRLPEHMFDSAKTVISRATLNTHSKVSSFSGGLNSRSGRLRRSLKIAVTGDTLNTLSGKVSTNIVYAPIHETGGVIRAKNKYMGVSGGPYLNIPLRGNKTAAGVMRQDARSVFSSGGYIIRSRLGKHIVMSGAGIPMFVLVKQVTIPARLGMRSAAQGEIPTILSSLNDLLLSDV